MGVEAAGGGGWAAAALGLCIMTRSAGDWGTGKLEGDDLEEACL
jgi:hypothetical protein